VRNDARLLKWIQLPYALRYVDPERLIVAPDCGMKYLPRDKAFGKLSVLAEAAARVRDEL